MKKTLMILALVLAVAMLFAACTPATETSPTPPVNNTTPDSGNNDPTPDSGGDDDDTGSGLGDIEDGAKLVYWTMWNEAEPQGMVIAEAAEAFQQATGVEIEINFNGRNIRQTLEPALAGGEEIDLFDEDIERVLNVWGDYLLPLDDYVNATYSDTQGKSYRDNVSATLINLAEELGAAKNFADGGKIHNIPYQPSTYVVQYNKGLFEKAGITGTPKTWEEFQDVCAKLKDAGITPITVDNLYMGALFGYTMSRIAGMEKTNEMVATRDFSDPSVLRAAEIWEDMIQKGYMSQKAATNIYPAGQVEEMAKETVAMYLNGTWLPNEIKGEAPADMKWGQFAWPAIDATGDGIETNNYGCQTFGIHKDTQYPNAAFAFIRFLTVGEWDQKLAAETLGVPVGNSTEWPAQTAEAKVIIDNTTKRMNWACGMEDDPEINSVIMEAFAKMVSGSFTAQQFADAMADLKQ